MTPQHEWLRQLIGTWTFESVCDGGPDGDEIRVPGRETVRAMVSDINRAWDNLEKAEHERELALREELIR